MANKLSKYTSYPFAWSFSSIEIASTAMQATILGVILNQILVISQLLRITWVKQSRQNMSSYNCPNEFQTSQRLGPRISITWNSCNAYFFNFSNINSDSTMHICIRTNQNIVISLSTFVMNPWYTITPVQSTWSGWTTKTWQLVKWLVRFVLNSRKILISNNIIYCYHI